VSLFSDGVFAVLITILVLELKPPHAYHFSDLQPLWPTGLSYAVSYFFIAIVWVNHHHLFGYAQAATPRLVWSNFAHLFSVSLIPFTTEWIADSRLAAAPVALYAAVFVLVNATYVALCWGSRRSTVPRGRLTSDAAIAGNEVICHHRGVRIGGRRCPVVADGGHDADLPVSRRLPSARYSDSPEPGGGQLSLS
jgi:uncharacterized membrane protein